MQLSFLLPNYNYNLNRRKKEKNAQTNEKCYCWERLFHASINPILSRLRITRWSEEEHPRVTGALSSYENRKINLRALINKGNTRIMCYYQVFPFRYRDAKRASRARTLSARRSEQIIPPHLVLSSVKERPC